MSFWQVGSKAALLAFGGQVKSVTLSASPPPPPPPPPDGLNVVWKAEFVDIPGDQTKITINNDGSTVLTVRQYANMTIDAVDTRSESTGCNTDHGAAQLIGFAARYNDGAGRTWPTSGLPRDYDIGEPIFHHVWDTAGTFPLELWARDPDNRQVKVTATVVVQPLGAITDISSGGSWPTLVDFGVYGLARGGNYNSRGDLRTDNLVGVRIIATGSGADPIVSAFVPDSRGLTSTALTTRARDCVAVGLDCGDFKTGLVGASYCGTYGGHTRLTTLYSEPQRYYYEHSGIAANNRNQANNIRYMRGCFVVDGGVVGSGGTQYCWIGGGRSFNLAGTTFRRDSGAGNGNPMRTYLDFTCMRHVQMWSTTETIGWLKGSLFPNVYAATPSDPWPDDDRFGDFDIDRTLYTTYGNDTNAIGNFGVGGRYFWVSDCKFGGPDQFGLPGYLGGWNPQNNDPPTNGLTGPWHAENCYESGKIGGWERNRMTYNKSDSIIALSGLGLSDRDNRQLNGTVIVASVNANPLRTHPDYLGPYYQSARPVVVMD